MDTWQRHQHIFRLINRTISHPICQKFNMTHEDLHVDGPILLVPNHASAWDPLLVAASLRDKQVYYVASEHLFRLGLVSQVIDYLVAPIPRRKASTGMDTVKACLRHLKAGHSVCLFAEGEQCWAGQNNPIFPATGKLAKSSGATLVTYRLEGAYLSLPRWGRGIRRGRVHGHPVGIYPPEALRDMSAEEVNGLITRDIREDAWERQRQEPVPYRGKNRAEGMERAVFWNIWKPASTGRIILSRRSPSGMPGRRKPCTAGTLPGRARTGCSFPTAASACIASAPGTRKSFSAAGTCCSMKTGWNVPASAFR